MWRHNGPDSVSNHQPYDCLPNRLFRRRSKKSSKFRVTGLCAGIHRRPVNSPHKWPVSRKMFPFDDVIMNRVQLTTVSKEIHAWHLPPPHHKLPVMWIVFLCLELNMQLNSCSTNHNCVQTITFMIGSSAIVYFCVTPNYIMNHSYQPKLVCGYFRLWNLLIRGIYWD